MIVPLIAIQLLRIHLVADGIPALALAMEDAALVLLLVLAALTSLYWLR
jgi:magnesium-transporting ATPase (P-type)